MTDERIARCACGALSATARGDPVRISICHCLDCKRRSGSAFSYNATYAAAQVSTRGEHGTYRRTGDEGRWADFHFCPRCGTTVFYQIEARPGMVTVPAGGFADMGFPEPTVEVYGKRRPDWCVIQSTGPLAEE